MPQTDLLLITPPFVQLNTPYPATPSLTGFLQEHSFEVVQQDLSIECIVKLLSKEGLKIIFDFAKGNKFSENAGRIFSLKNEYIRYIDAVVSFLQGKDTTFVHSINTGVLPEASRFNIQQDLEWHFGTDGVQDKAKFLSTLFIEDIGDFITECVDERFGFSRYAEKISVNVIDYQTILDELTINTPITEMMCELLDKSIKKHQPQIIGFTIPFPGNLLPALKSAEFIKKNYPDIFTVIGGGYVNTELRELSETRLFELIDYVCLDAGELCLSELLDYILRGGKFLSRTFILEKGKIKFINNTDKKDFAHENIGTPVYLNLPLDKYISVAETTNRMHNLWTSERWNKMMLAHGCYWHRCSFCDTSLDYIKRYSPANANVLCNRMEAIIKQTGQSGFHFVDEAASPEVLQKLAKEIISRNLSVTWWTNIRFESGFTDELCTLLAKSGCIAVSGGLEVASNRLLKKMNKGISLKSVTRVTAAFQNSGIMVHAYLMYGFPTQTAQETIDSLEVVRQLFSNKLIQSAFWHQFVMTVHSPVGILPEKFETERIFPNSKPFAQNGCEHIDTTGCKHEMYSAGLKKALYNYIHDNGLDFKLQEWFDFKIPKTKISANYIAKFLKYGRN